MIWRIIFSVLWLFTFWFLIYTISMFRKIVCGRLSGDDVSSLIPPFLRQIRPRLRRTAFALTVAAATGLSLCLRWSGQIDAVWAAAMAVPWALLIFVLVYRQSLLASRAVLTALGTASVLILLQSWNDDPRRLFPNLLFDSIDGVKMMEQAAVVYKVVCVGGAAAALSLIAKGVSWILDHSKEDGKKDGPSPMEKNRVTALEDFADKRAASVFFILMGAVLLAGLAMLWRFIDVEPAAASGGEPRPFRVYLLMVSLFLYTAALFWRRGTRESALLDAERDGMGLLLVKMTLAPGGKTEEEEDWNRFCELFLHILYSPNADNYLSYKKNAKTMLSHAVKLREERGYCPDQDAVGFFMRHRRIYTSVMGVPLEQLWKESEKRYIECCQAVFRAFARPGPPLSLLWFLFHMWDEKYRSDWKLPPDALNAVYFYQYIFFELMKEYEAEYEGNDGKKLCGLCTRKDCPWDKSSQARKKREWNAVETMLLYGADVVEKVRIIIGTDEDREKAYANGCGRYYQRLLSSEAENRPRFRFIREGDAEIRELNLERLANPPYLDAVKAALPEKPMNPKAALSWIQRHTGNPKKGEADQATLYIYKTAAKLGRAKSRNRPKDKDLEDILTYTSLLIANYAAKEGNNNSEKEDDE